MRVKWCVDLGFEYLEIDVRRLAQGIPMILLDYVLRYVIGWEAREKEGLPRLVEALETNMWSTLIRKMGKSS
jgi:hypothetical protein